LAVETIEYLSAAKRFIRAAGRRVADADEIELSELLSLQTVLDEAVQAAIDGQRARGHSWAYIALATGTTRQAAFQRWGKK
jgi:malonyl CoA-acyl carrier protein transacylase